VPSPAGGAASPAAGVLGGVDAGGVVGGLLVGGSVVGGADVVVAGAEEDVLVVGDDVGVEDCRSLVVGLADGVAEGAFDAIPRLVLVP
jgi:hypothetical protein